MSAHVLLNLLNKLGKAIRRGASKLPNEFSKYNNTRVRMLDSIYHRTFKLHKIAFLALKISRVCHIYAT